MQIIIQINLKETWKMNYKKCIKNKNYKIKLIFIESWKYFVACSSSKKIVALLIKNS